jgi:hypothetical protein
MSLQGCQTDEAKTASGKQLRAMSLNMIHGYLTTTPLMCVWTRTAEQCGERQTGVEGGGLAVILACETFCVSHHVCRHGPAAL